MSGKRVWKQEFLAHHGRKLKVRFRQAGHEEVWLFTDLSYFARMWRPRTLLTAVGAREPFCCLVKSQEQQHDQ